jgi:endonuclease/exonuclease/phosphatase family metal-dependent hydrolase
MARWAVMMAAAAGLAALTCLAGCDHSPPRPAAAEKAGDHSPAQPAAAEKSTELPQPRPAATGEAGLLRVMTFNVRTSVAKDGADGWDNRKAFLAETVKTFDPDLLGVQEAMQAQADYLRQQLESYGFEGVARDDGKQAGEYSAIFYRKARFERLDGGTFWLSPTPEKPGLGWDAACIRIVTWTRLKDRATGRSFAYFNTHWDHVGNVARVESAKLMRRRIAGEAMPVLVTGDLNSGEESKQVRELLGGAPGARLFNAYREMHPTKGPDEATFHEFSGKTAGSPIDYILYTAPFVVRKAAIDRTSRQGRYPSDHFPVTAILELR